MLFQFVSHLNYILVQILVLDIDIKLYLREYESITEIFFRKPGRRTKYFEVFFVLQ